VIDYNYIGMCMEEYLTSEIALEMGEFLQSELLTPNWLRALSLKDKVILKTNRRINIKVAPILRPDHGSDGSYAAWPALAAQVSGNNSDLIL
jgi:hypothetical protein